MKSKSYKITSDDLMLAGLIMAILLYAISLLGLPAAEIGNHNARLVLELGAQERVFEGTVTDNMSVLDALIAATNAGNISLQYSLASGNKTDIQSIDNKNSFYFYLNSDPIEPTLLHLAQIKGGDEIRVIIR